MIQSLSTKPHLSLMFASFVFLGMLTLSHSPALAGFSGPGGPRLNLDRPPKIAPYDKSDIPPDTKEKKNNAAPRAQPPRAVGPRARPENNKLPQPSGPDRTRQAKPQAPSAPDRQVEKRPNRNQADPQRAQASRPSGRRAGKPNAPQDANQRRMLLTELYSYLNKAKSPDQAQRLATSIERLWMHSDSPTTSLLMKRTDRAIETGRWRIAERFADAVVKLDGEYTEGLMRRAYVRYQLNQSTRALRDLRRVLSLEPNHFIALDRIGAIQNSLGEHKAALKSYRKLKRINPKAPGVDDRIEALTRKVDGEAI